MTTENTTTTTEKRPTMTQKEALERSIALAKDAEDAALEERLTQWLDKLNVPREKTKSSAEIQRENRAREVAEIVINHGKPVTNAWLTENVDGWNISPETGKVMPQSITGVMRKAVKMGLLKSDNRGDKGKARYMPVDYEVVVEED